MWVLLSSKTSIWEIFWYHCRLMTHIRDFPETSQKLGKDMVVLDEAFDASYSSPGSVVEPEKLQTRAELGVG